MLKNASLLAKIDADTTENEQHFAEILPIGRRVADGRRSEAPRLRRAARPGAPLRELAGRTLGVREDLG